VAAREDSSARAAYDLLEEGKILFFPTRPFDLPAEHQEFLRSIHQTGSAHHKNIAYRPMSDKVTGFDSASAANAEKLRCVMRNFSSAALGFLKSHLPRYMENCRIDYASFRPLEEEGRDLSFTKRNDLLHVDAFPTRPTGGDLILRTFVNIHPTRSRVWLISDPFQPLAAQHAAAAGWPHTGAWDRVASLFNHRTPYDYFMLRFHDYLKANAEYQKNCTKYRWEFPPGSAWIVFTDIAPHAVLSGQYALEQTVIVSRHALLSPARAPVEILKSLA